MLGKTALRRLRRGEIVLHVCWSLWSPPLQSFETRTLVDTVCVHSAWVAYC